jgi:hypothetical protein
MFPTKGTSLAGSGVRRRCTSAMSRIGFSISGPLSVKLTLTPIASTGMSMSEKKITASTPTIRNG